MKSPNSARKTIHLTGERHSDRVRILLDGETALLPCAILGALVELLVAGIQTESRYVAICRRTILRLRKAIDATTGKGAGNRLIETGFNGQYRLNIPRDEIATRVAVTPCFFELVDLAVVSPAQAEAIRAACPLLRLV